MNYTIRLNKILAASVAAIFSATVFAAQDNAVNFQGERESSSFYDLAGVDFNTSTLTYNAPDNSQSGVAFKDLDLTYARFDVVDLTNANFAGKDLSYADIQDSYVTGADFTGANITGIHIYNPNFSKAQIQSTYNWSIKDMSNMTISGVRHDVNGTVGMYYDIFAGEDLNGFNLSSSRFDYSNFQNTNFTGANVLGISLCASDLRGATGLSASDMRTSGSFVWTDGRIMHYDSTSEEIKEGAYGKLNTSSIYVAGAHELDAVLTKTSYIYELSVAEGGVLKVEEGVTLSWGSFGMNGSELGTSLIKLAGTLDLENSGIWGMTIPIDFDREGYYEFMIIEFEGDGSIVGSFDKDTFLVGHSFMDDSLAFYDGVWNIIVKENGVMLTFGTLPEIPEPSEFAAAFGLLALGFAAYRRRK